MRTHPRPLPGRLAPALIALALLAAAPLSWATAAAPKAAASAPKAASKAAPAKPAPQRLVDINSASRKQLKALPGIGDAEAERIVAGRPYRSKADLVAAKAIPEGTYHAIKASIIARQPSPPKTSKK